MNHNESPQPRPYTRRASDTYVPLSLVIHGVATIGVLFAIWGAVSTSIAAQEKRMTTLEVRMERLGEIANQLDQLDKSCRLK
jgi:hypothetical protein